MNNPRILFLDIETSPNLTYVWNLHQEIHTMDMWVKEWYILCWCASFKGDKTMITSALPDFAKEYKADKENDRFILDKLWKLLDEADIVVGHNSVAFDLKKINARFAIHNMKPPSPYKTVDTLLSARKHFDFTSNKLADLGKTLGLGEKIDTGGFSLWKRCISGDMSAWKHMVKYCSNDVILLEKIYLRLLPFMQTHPNFNNYIDEVNPVCTNCGSKNLQMNGFAYSNQAKYQRVVCKDCGTNCRYKTNMLKNKVKVVSN